MTGVRISGGSLRGRLVPVPPHDLRPTSGKARQAYFNIVGGSLADAHFLDLFAGSGIFSFEALSRGASRAVAVDSSRTSCESIRKHAQTLGVRIEVVQRDVLQALRHVSGSFNLVYADPPYDWDHYPELLATLDSLPMTDEAVIAIEHSSSRRIEAASPLRKLVHRRTARYGAVAISLFDHASGIDAPQSSFATEESSTDKKEGFDVTNAQ